MEDKPIRATDIVNDPDIIDELTNQYVLIRDSSIMGSYKNLIAAINILGDYGWETVSLSGDANSNMFALCRNPYYKRKNDRFNG